MDARALRVFVLVCGVGMSIALAPRPAPGIELADGRVQVHGFYEMQLRAIARDFDATDDWDMTQWYHVFNVEVDASIAPDGWGPFDLISAFAHVEVRYDCVWTRACGIFPSVNAFGDRTERLPKRLADGQRAGFRSTGALFNGDTRFFRDIPRDKLPYEFRDRERGSRVLSPLFNIEGIDTLFDSPGVDGVFGTADDPAPFYFSGVLDDECDFTFRKRKGSQGGVGSQILGPWRPACRIRPLAKLAEFPNPLRANDFNPITGAGGAGALPLRPAPRAAAGSGAPLDRAQGVYYPNAELARRIENGDFDSFDQNFRQAELEWNRGASQQDEKELKELFLDIEMFDSRLWIRAGKQTVVWGKTELFRNQDQWNPQDLALASLPSLEESRIGLWMGRFVWHFWDVGPLQDVRAELVVLYDQFEPTDLGRCGEPYAPNPVCDKAFGLFVHGLTGFGVAGEIRPPDPWNSWKGIEAGARLEWRWSRFSFAVTDYYGYTDLPHQETLFRYSRNVDPRTGRPRHTESTDRCRTGREEACLRASNALAEHSVNQQLFNMICATSIGFNSLDFTACGQTVFNSQILADPTNPLSPIVSVALTNILSGQNFGGLPVTHGAAVLETLGTLATGTPGNISAPSLVALNRFPNVNRYASSTPGVTAFCIANFGMTCPTPLVPLNADPRDGGPAVPFAIVPDGVSVWAVSGLSPFLTDEQEALLGCGPFYLTNCDLHGVDLENAEATALLQSFPGIEGTSGSVFEWDTTDRGRAQPGTVGFEGGPVCTRFERGRLTILPGCRGPGDKGYSINVDGSTTGLVHPFTGQRFRTEMAAVSWNALMGLVALSQPTNPGRPTVTEFDANRPFRTDGCSFAVPTICGNVQSLFQVTGLQRDTVRAGGNGIFGRRDFVWHGGKDIALRYQKRNILGFSMDFAEDVTKSNVGLEFTWENDILVADQDEIDTLSEVDVYNLTVSVDRPTFVNFLNANRTFFLNAQVFFQYVDGYAESFVGNGPWNVLGVFTIQTGYFDDRLLPAMSLVYDMRSNSGAWIPQVQYRFSSNFSATVGMALFAGREQPRDMALSPLTLSNRAARHAYTDFVENGLSAIRDRDEVFMRIRYTF